MSREVLLSKRASIKISNLLEYIKINWSQRVKDNFIKKLNQVIEIIKEHPESGIKSNTIKGLYKFIITKQSTLYYKFDDNYIFIVTVFDTRQNPKKLKQDIKN